MKKQLQTKHKVMIGVGAGLLGAAAIATPLAITLTQNNNLSPTNIDEQYGVDQVTYDTMKEDLKNQYYANLTSSRLKPTVIDGCMYKLKKTCDDLDTNVMQLKQNNMSNVHTTATTVLMRIAKQKFSNFGSIDLVRNSRANWNEVQQVFKGMCSSFRTYMENHFFTNKKIKEVINNATTQYNKMMDEFKVTYSNDILGGVMKAKTQLFTFFGTINAQIARLAGMTRLNEFVSNHSFDFRIDASSAKIGTNDNRLDVIKNKLEEGKPIDAKYMNQMFVIYNVETRQEVKFDTKMLAGYTIQPVFMGFDQDNETNTRSIKIDWTIVGDYVQPEHIAESTAHLVENSEQLVQKTNSIQSLDQAMDELNTSVKITNYDMLASADHESDSLKEAYLGSKTSNFIGIEIGWFADASEELKSGWCYDGFMYADQKKLGEKQELTMMQLAQTGVLIRTKDGANTERLYDVINRIMQKDYEPKTTIEKFVKHCSISGEVIIDSNKNVETTFFAEYNNEQNWKKHYQSGSTRQEVTPTDAKSTFAPGFDISDEFFKLANDNFNIAYKHAHSLLDMGYEKIQDKADLQSVAAHLAYAGGLLCETATLMAMIASIVAHKWDWVFVHLITLGLETAFMVPSSIYIDKFEREFETPLNSFAARAKKFEASDAYIKVKKAFDEDTKHFSLEVDGKYPDYEEKKAAFKTLDPVYQQELFTRYRYFEVDFAVDFFKKAEELHINPEQFKADMADWVSEGGRSLEITLLCDLGSLASCVGMALVGKALEGYRDPVLRKELEKEELAEKEFWAQRFYSGEMTWEEIVEHGMQNWLYLPGGGL